MIACRGLAALALLSAACGTVEVRPLNAIPLTAPIAAPVEVKTRPSGASDPVRLAGTRFAFAGLEAPLGHAVATAVVPWAQSRAGEPGGGFRLLVELTQAVARVRGHRVEITLAARATLSTREGQHYLGQTQVHCHEARLVAPVDAAPVFYDCMSELGRDLAGWLGGLPPVAL